MRISEEKFLELLDKNAVKYGIVNGNFEILDDGENVKLYKQYLQDENSARKLLELVQERQKRNEFKLELSNAEQIAEVKFGELTAAMPKVQGKRTDVTSPSRAEKLNTEQEALSKVNISSQQASQYELMASNPEIVEPEQAEQVSAKALEVWQRLRKWLTQYGNLNENKLTLEMMMAELERQNAPIFELDLKIYLRELIESGYVKVHREYRERLGRPAAVTTYYVIEYCTKAFNTRTTT